MVGKKCTSQVFSSAVLLKTTAQAGRYDHDDTDDTIYIHTLITTVIRLH
jgi:hypothetical protein